MNIRSKQLLVYLLEHNVDFQDKEALATAKREYRKQYKKKWKTTAKKNREVRPTFTEQEYQAICIRADLLGLPPTTYVRELVLTSQENRELIPNKEQLLQILQCVSRAVIQNKNDSLLAEAEQLLLDYLQNH